MPQSLLLHRVNFLENLVKGAICSGEFYINLLLDGLHPLQSRLNRVIGHL